MLAFDVDVTKGYCALSWATDLDTAPFRKALPITLAERVFTLGILDWAELEQFPAPAIVIPSLAATRVRAPPDARTLTITTRWSQMWIGTSNQPPSWNGFRPIHTVFNYARAARVAIASNIDLAPYKWIKVAWQTTNCVGLIVRDIAGESFLLIARSYLRQRARQYYVQDGLVMWARGQHIAGLTKTSVRAWSLFKFFIRVVGATSTHSDQLEVRNLSAEFLLHANDRNDLNIEVRNLSAAYLHANVSDDLNLEVLNFSDAFLHANDRDDLNTFVRCMYSAGYHSTTAWGEQPVHDATAAVWYNAVWGDAIQTAYGMIAIQAEYDMVVDSCNTSLLLGAPADPGSIPFGVNTMKLEPKMLAWSPQFYIDTSGRLRHHENAQKDLPDLGLFLVVIAMAAAVLCLHTTLERASQLEFRHRRPLVPDEMAWVKECVRSLKCARHALYTLARSLCPRTGTVFGKWNDFVPARFKIRLMHLLDDLGAQHAPAYIATGSLATDTVARDPPHLAPKVLGAEGLVGMSFRHAVSHALVSYRLDCITDPTPLVVRDGYSFEHPVVSDRPSPDIVRIYAGMFRFELSADALTLATSYGWYYNAAAILAADYAYTFTGLEMAVAASGVFRVAVTITHNAYEFTFCGNHKDYMHAFDNACARAIIEMPKALLKMEKMFGGPSEPCPDDGASEYVVADVPTVKLPYTGLRLPSDSMGARVPQVRTSAASALRGVHCGPYQDPLDTTRPGPYHASSVNRKHRVRSHAAATRIQQHAKSWSTHGQKDTSRKSRHGGRRDSRNVRRDFMFSGHGSLYSTESATATVLAMLTSFLCAVHMQLGYTVSAASALAVLLVSAHPVYRSTETRRTCAVTDSVVSRWITALWASTPPVTVSKAARNWAKKSRKQLRPTQAHRLERRLDTAGRLLVVPHAKGGPALLRRHAMLWVFACFATLSIVTFWATDNAGLATGSVGADSSVGACPAGGMTATNTTISSTSTAMSQLEAYNSDQAYPQPGTLEYRRLTGGDTPTTIADLCNTVLPEHMFIHAQYSAQPPSCPVSSRPFSVFAFNVDRAYSGTPTPETKMLRYRVSKNQAGEPIDTGHFQDCGDWVWVTNDSAAEASVTPFPEDAYEITSTERIKVTGYNGAVSMSEGRCTIKYKYMVEDGTFHTRDIHNVTILPSAQTRLFGQAHDNDDGGFRQVDCFRYNLDPEGRRIPIVRVRNLMKFPIVVMHKHRESKIPRDAISDWRTRSVPHLHCMDQIRAEQERGTNPKNVNATGEHHRSLDPLLVNMFTTSSAENTAPGETVENMNKQATLVARRKKAVASLPFATVQARLGSCDARFLVMDGFKKPKGFVKPDEAYAKMSRTNVSTILNPKAKAAGDRFNMDIAGPFPAAIGTPFKLVIGFTDSASGMSFAYPMCKKSESAARLKHLIMTLRQYNVTLKTLVSDNDSCFKALSFTSVCDEHNIHRQYSAPECQWQNGVAEAFVGRCKHLGSAMLARLRVDTKTRDQYTVHAMLNAAHASNFICKASGTSPVNAWAKLTKTSPASMHDLRVFGSKSWVYDSAHKSLAPRALEARVLGCATACGIGEYDSDTWLVHILSTGATRVSRHVMFDEQTGSLSAEQVAHQALLMTKWTEEFKLRAPSSNADTVPENRPDNAFPATDDSEVSSGPYLTILATKGSNPGPAVDAVRFTGGTLVLGPNINRALAYISTRCIARVGHKVDTVMGTAFVSKHGTKRRYTKNDFGYDLANQYLAVAVLNEGGGADTEATHSVGSNAPRQPATAGDARAPVAPVALATLPMQGMFTVQVSQSIADIAEIFRVGADEVISHATNHITAAGIPMNLTANTRFTPGADIRIPLNAIVPADVTLTQIPDQIPDPVQAPVGPAVNSFSVDTQDRDTWLIDNDERLAIQAFREQYTGSADVYLDVDDEMFLFRKKSHAPFSLHAFTMPTDDMPSVKGALSGPHRDKWLAAIEAEYNSLDEHNTWVLVSKPRHARAIDVKLVLKRKRDRHGEITKYKARLVLRGDQCDPYDALTQLYTPVACIPSFRLMCSIAAEHDYELNSLDFTTAFLNAKCDATVYAKQAPHREIKLDSDGVPMVYHMRKSCYGLPFAPKLWHDMLHSWLTDYGFVRSVHDPCVYTLGKIVILCYVDDLSVLFPTQEKPAYDKFLADLAKKFKYTGGGPIDHFLGYGITRDRKAHTLKIDQYAFIDTVLQEHAKHDTGDASVPVHIPHKSDVRLGIQLCPGDDAEGRKEKAIMKTKPFREVVGSLLWLMRGTRPDLAYVVGMLGRVMHNPGLAHWAAALQALAYVRTTQQLALTYSRSGVPMDCSVDADWLPNYGTEFDNWKSTSGYHVYNANAAVTWRSKRQDVIATSTPHAECLAAYEVIRDVILMRGLKADMGHEETKPTVLQEDNQTLVRTSLNQSGTDRIKHWDYKVHWIRQCVADGIVTFAWVNSTDQMSDTATKPLPRPAFEKQRDHNMGIARVKFKVHTEIYRENAHKFPDAKAKATLSPSTPGIGKH
jgi:transposase InsO family protein